MKRGYSKEEAQQIVKKRLAANPKRREHYSSDIEYEQALKSFTESKYGDINNWISTGSYALNRIISGSIYKGIPSGRVIILGGESSCTPINRKIMILRKRFN